MEQQREAGALGMWVFLVTEIMFFGGMFFAYTLYRRTFPDAFASASNHLDLTLGTVNTIVLIFTIVLGLTFLGIKAVEYNDKYESSLIPGELIPGHKFKPKVQRPGEPHD